LKKDYVSHIKIKIKKNLFYFTYPINSSAVEEMTTTNEAEFDQKVAILRETFGEYPGE